MLKLATQDKQIKCLLHNNRCFLKIMYVKARNFRISLKIFNYKCFIDMIKFKIRKVFWIRKTAELTGPHQSFALDPLGAHSTPQTLDCFSKTAIPKFSLHTSLMCLYIFYVYVPLWLDLFCMYLCAYNLSGPWDWHKCSWSEVWWKLAI